MLALRGHEPIIYEATNEIGGNLIPGGVPDFKEDDIALIKWYEHELNRLGVTINFNYEATSKTISERKADAVIIATGSKPKMFSLGNDSRVFSAADVLCGKVDNINKAVVVGGGLSGCETALWLAQNGKKVTIVETLPKLLALNAPLCHANSEMLELLVPYNGIEVKTSSRLVKAVDNAVVINNNGTEEEIETDTVILAVGYTSQAELYEQLKFNVEELYLLGDARKVANIMYAIWDAYEVASKI